jgi:hypothetical protein
LFSEKNKEAEKIDVLSEYFFGDACNASTSDVLGCHNHTHGAPKVCRHFESIGVNADETTRNFESAIAYWFFFLFFLFFLFDCSFLLLFLIFVSCLALIPLRSYFFPVLTPIGSNRLHGLGAPCVWLWQPNTSLVVVHSQLHIASYRYLILRGDVFWTHVQITFFKSVRCTVLWTECSIGFSMLRDVA